MHYMSRNKNECKRKLADYQRQFGVYAEANSEAMGAFGATVTAAIVFTVSL